MKIAKDRLKQIIKEELSLENAEEPNGDMIRQNLYKIGEYAERLYHIVDGGQDLDPWIQDKLAIAAYIMDSVGHHLEYEEHEEEGHEGHEEEHGLESDHDVEIEFVPDEGEEEYEYSDEGGEEEYGSSDEEGEEYEEEDEYHPSDEEEEG